MADSSIQFLVSLNAASGGEQNTVYRKVQALAEQLNTQGPSCPPQLRELCTSPVEQIAVGPNHLAFLLQDGRVARVALKVFTDRLQAEKSHDTPKPKSNNDGGGGGGGSSGAGSGGGSGGNSSSASLASRTAKFRRVMMAARSGRGRGVIVGSRPLIPASAIPEDLIAQAQTVLQGKSREAIVRELQRTNLDVNQAVNNLLSREDEDGDDGEDGPDQYLPEELISLLDAGLQSGEHPTSVILDADSFYTGDVFEYASVAARRRAERGRDIRRIEKALQDRSAAEGGADMLKQSVDASSPISVGSKLEFWNDLNGSPLKFSHIGALYSELVAVSESDGGLCSWPWSWAYPIEGPHYKSVSLGFEVPNSNAEGDKPQERIVAISCSLSRCTLLTEKNRVAAFMDTSLGKEGTSALDTSLTEISLGPLGILSSSTFSLAFTPSGQATWWGAWPFSLRKREWEKVRSKDRKKVTFEMSEIKIGSEVRLRSNPIYQAGSLGISMVNGYPQLGELMEAAWTLSETCRFRIKNQEELRKELWPSSEPRISGKEEIRSDIGGGYWAPAPEGLRPQEQMESRREGGNDGTSESGGGESAGDDAAAARQRDIREFVEIRSGQQRKRSASSAFREGDSNAREEAWSLKDVVFIREQSHQDTGRVMMVDGAYCGVLFSRDGNDELNAENLKRMRLMRKDDLQPTSSANIPRSPETIHNSLNKFSLPLKDSVLVDVSVDDDGVQYVMEKEGKAWLARGNLIGRLEKETLLPVHAGALAGCNVVKPRLISSGGHKGIGMILDGNGCILPLDRNSVGGIREPAPLLLGPIQRLGIGTCPLPKSSSNKSNRAVVAVLYSRPSTLMKHILHCDVESTEEWIQGLEKETNLDRAQEEIGNARLEGNRNIIHAAVMLCRAERNKENADADEVPSAAAASARNLYDARWDSIIGRSSRSGGGAFSVEEFMEMAGRRFEQGGGRRASADPYSEALANVPAPRPDGPRLNWPPSDRPADESGSMQPPPKDESLDAVDPANIPLPSVPSAPRPLSDPKERQKAAVRILKSLCEHPFMTSYLLELLTARDALGHTPFMSAVTNRAYSAALIIWDTAERLSKATSQSSEPLMHMIFPPESKSSDSPLFVVCFNDTCSFTWTGDEHINQDIFECRTCGLVGSLCCCTECAYVCHKNHDCKLKKTSPTAYCDCWERCKCKALVAGNQTARFDLLNRLLTSTDLVSRTTAKGEHILLFLVRTVGRQGVEQRQFRPSRSKQAHKAADGVPEMPEHDLDPPKFAKKALERLLTDWKSVKSMVMLGIKSSESSGLVDEDAFHLGSQSGVTYLDQFTSALIGKCTQDMLDILLSTLIRESQRGPNGDQEVHFVVRRFVRSLVRVYLVVSVCTSPVGSRRRRLSLHQPVLKCRRAFQALASYSLLELAAAGDAVFAPVRLGLLKPSQPFAFISSCPDAVDMIDKLFASHPVPTLDATDGSGIPMAEADTLPAVERPLEEEPADETVGPEDEDLEPTGGDGDIESESASEGEMDSETERVGGRNGAERDNGANEENEPSEGDVSTSATIPFPSSNNQNPEDNDSRENEEREGNEESASRDMVYYSDGESVGSSHSDGQGEREEAMDTDDSRSRQSRTQGGGDEGGASERDDGETGESERDSSDSEQNDTEDPDTDPARDSISGDFDFRNLPFPASSSGRQGGSSSSSANRGTSSNHQPLTPLHAQSSSSAHRNTGRNTWESAFGRGYPPSSISWAVRRESRGGQGSSAGGGGGGSNEVPTPPERGSGLIFLDTSVPPPPSRPARTGQPTTGTFTGLGTGAVPGKGSGEEIPSLGTSAAQLARTYSIVVRQIADLLVLVHDYKLLAPNLPCVLTITPDDAVAIQATVTKRLQPTWEWLFSVLDIIESQLKFGSALAGVTDLSQYSLPSFQPGSSSSSGGTSSRSGGREVRSSQRDSSSSRRQTDPRTAESSRRLINLTSNYSGTEQPTTQYTSARQDFVSYLLSLLRAQSGEHGDDFPVLDISSLRHVAYVADSLLYFAETKSKAGASSNKIGGGMEDSTSNLLETWESKFSNKFAPEIFEDSNEAGPSDEPSDSGSVRKFFKRSRSLLYPGVPLKLGPFEHSLADSLPLARKPHLLRPDSTKELLFGVTAKAMSHDEHQGKLKEMGVRNPTHLSLAKPIKLGHAKPGQEPGDSKTGQAKEFAERGSVIVPTSRPSFQIGGSSLSGSDTEMVAEEPSTIQDSQQAPPTGVATITVAQLSGATETETGKEDLMDGQALLGRWKLSLSILAKVFTDGSNGEQGSVLAQLAGFSLRESRFRKEMEKLRNQQSKDLTMEVERDRKLLIQQTIKELNQFYSRRSAGLSGSALPMTIHKVKVTFKNEPGEGSGVARSFYAAIAEALLSPDSLPNLEAAQATNMSGNSLRTQQHLLNRLRSRERLREIHRRGRSSFGSHVRRFPMSLDAPPFSMGSAEEAALGALNQNASSGPQPISGPGAAVTNWDPSKQTLGERLYPRVMALREHLAPKITGMLLELPAQHIVTLMTSDETLRVHVEEATDMILQQQQTSQSGNAAGNGNEEPKESMETPKMKKSQSAAAVLDPDEFIDNAPLFFQPGNSGFFSPVPGKNSPERLNAFRNVGRLMGICLLQNEVLPLHLCRHVLKLILGRPVNWFDLAFFDADLFENLRSIAEEGSDPAALDLNFEVNLSHHEGGNTVELIQNGKNVAVTSQNVIDYVYRYVELRMVKLASKPIEAMKQGVFDVIPNYSLEGFTAEDLRLLLCGTRDISSRILQSYTSFADESSAAAEQLSQFKRWFWSVVSKMNSDDRQDLVYFWTGSPALPSSEEGFQPLPSVMIRPADDAHLPTANTCISRLYVPLYSSKQILREKILLAIKARNFGFV